MKVRREKASTQLLVFSCHLSKLQRTILQFARMKALFTQKLSAGALRRHKRGPRTLSRNSNLPGWQRYVAPKAGAVFKKKKKKK